MMASLRVLRGFWQSRMFFKVCFCRKCWYFCPEFSIRVVWCLGVYAFVWVLGLFSVFAFIACGIWFFPKQLQLMGFLILAKKQTLLQHDFQVCLPLSPFYWILFRHDFQFCHDFQVCLPLSPFYWILFRHDFQVCLPLSPFYWILSHHEFEASLCLCPFVSLLLDPAHHDCEASPRLTPLTGLNSIMILRLSPFVSLFPPSTGSSSVMISRLFFLCLPSTGSSLIIEFGACPRLHPVYRIEFHQSPFVSLLLDPVPSLFRGLFFFGSVCPPSNSPAQRSKSTIIQRFVSSCSLLNFRQRTWFEVSKIKLMRNAVWGRCWCNCWLAVLLHVRLWADCV